MQQARLFVTRDSGVAVGVFVGAGTLAENPIAPNDIDLQGGFDSATWVRDFHRNLTGITPSEGRGVVFREPQMTDGSSKMSGFMVNALSSAPAASGNISVDPEVDMTWHLMPSSPNRGAGTSGAGGAMAPSNDIDGEPRPQPTGTNPDIEPDERD